MEYRKYLIFKSIRGLDKPWLVFTPAERAKPSEDIWERGYATWHEALESIQ